MLTKPPNCPGGNYYYARELWAAEQALVRLRNKLATLPGWRASLAWEAAEDALDVLGRGMFDASELPAMPKNFRHWRDKYSDKVRM